MLLWCDLIFKERSDYKNGSTLVVIEDARTCTHKQKSKICALVELSQHHEVFTNRLL